MKKLLNAAGVVLHQVIREIAITIGLMIALFWTFGSTYYLIGQIGTLVFEKQLHWLCESATGIYWEKIIFVTAIIFWIGVALFFFRKALHKQHALRN